MCQKLRARRAETQADNAASQQAAAVQAAVAAAVAAAGVEGWPAFAGQEREECGGGGGGEGEGRVGEAGGHSRISSSRAVCPCPHYTASPHTLPSLPNHPPHLACSHSTFHTYVTLKATALMRTRTPWVCSSYHPAPPSGPNLQQRAKGSAQREAVQREAVQRDAVLREAVRRVAVQREAVLREAVRRRRRRPWRFPIIPKASCRH